MTTVIEYRGAGSRRDLLADRVASVHRSQSVTQSPPAID
jgi:hypothetical protein